MTQEDREEAVREHAEEILARQLTPDEIAEHEARARSNRIAEIMARKDPVKPTYSERNNALVVPGSKDSRPASRRYVDESFNNFRDAIVASIMSGKLFPPAILDRIEALETAVKPRVRVKAATRIT